MVRAVRPADRGASGGSSSCSSAQASKSLIQPSSPGRGVQPLPAGTSGSRAARRWTRRVRRRVQRAVVAVPGLGLAEHLPRLVELLHAAGVDGPGAVVGVGVEVGVVAARGGQVGPPDLPRLALRLDPEHLVVVHRTRSYGQPTGHASG